jgi:hydrogenase expression/formation protein HypC
MCLGIPGEVVDISDVADLKAIVEISGVRRAVNVGLVLKDDGDEGIKVGDWVLVHVGFAMSKIDREEAQRTTEFLQEMGRIFDEEIEQFSQTTPL